MSGKQHTLTDWQCDVFRRLPVSFNDMVRAIYDAGASVERQDCAKVCDDLAELVESGGSEKEPGHRLRQAGRIIRARGQE